jgi:hypothetical protein
MEALLGETIAQQVEQLHGRLGPRAMGQPPARRRLLIEVEPEEHWKAEEAAGNAMVHACAEHLQAALAQICETRT